MSRTKKGKKPIGYEYWGKRALSGYPPSKDTKVKTNRIERRTAKQAVNKEDLVENESTSVMAFLPKDHDDILVHDGTGYLALIRAVGLGPDLFGISAVDGGGFTGIVVSIKQWEEMKAKVDAYVKTLQ